MPYTLEEIVQILSIRASTEGLELEEEALAQLGEIGARTSLRYAVQLLTPARILSNTNGREKISTDEVDEIDKLFYDAKASARHLAAEDIHYLK